MKPPKVTLPHPADVAARKALAEMPPAPLSRVLEQARASQRWREAQSGLPTYSPGSSPLPVPGHARS